MMPRTDGAPAPGRLRSALISTAGHCAVACGFCFRADRTHGFLEVSTYSRALSRLRELGIAGVCLTGGEPTHHPGLRRLVRLTHQFGMSVSMVTSARTVSEVTRLGEVAHLLDSVTVSADSRGAMLLGRTSRSVESAVTTLREVREAAAPERILHLTYWQVTAEECRRIARLAAGAGAAVQLSPVTLDAAALRRAGMSRSEYLGQHRADAETLGRHFRLSTAFRRHLAALRAVYLAPGQRHPCRAVSLYVSAKGEVRRCPYSSAGVSVHAPRADIARFLAGNTGDFVTPDCAAICRTDP